MKLILKNEKSSDQLTYATGQVVIPAYGLLDVSPSYWFALYTDGSFLTDIRKNNIIINDGDKDLEFDKAEEYLKQLNDFNYNNKDIDGAIIVRSKAAKKGWSFWAVPMEITTATISGNVYSKDSNSVDIPGITCKIYNASGTEITSPGILDVNLATCVKTVLDFEPAFDYEMIGGALRINSNPAQDIRLWIVGAPDIPAIYGGSKEFASGINLKFMAPDSSFEIDGRVSKYVTYNATDHRGKLRIILKHPAGLQVNMQIVIHTYRL